MQVFNQQFGQQQLPNSTAVLVLGIISIVGCFCYGMPGLICGIIAIVLGGKDLRLYATNPQGYTPGSLSSLKAGRVCAFIGLSFSILYFLLIIFMIVTVGFAALTDPQHFIDHFNNR